MTFYKEYKWKKNDVFCPTKGCTDSEAKNYDSNAGIDDGTCVKYKYGCMDKNALNYDSTAEKDKGCIAKKEGCTDKNALNYDKTANVMKPNSCRLKVVGCMNE